jgi:hypothetical protein
MVDQQKRRAPVGAVERAFELARQGNFNMVSEITIALRKEGYDFAFQHLSSPTLVRQLRREIAMAKGYEPKGRPKLINSELRS